MYEEKRPTCVTVIGWAWIIIGGLMLFSSLGAFFASTMMGEMAPHEQDMPFMVKIFPMLAIFQAAVATLGIVGGINFLKFKEWARAVLEVLSWLLLCFIVLFSVFWVVNWISITSKHGSGNFDSIGAIMGVFVTGIYALPLIIILKYLRGHKVKSVMGKPG